MAEIERNTWGIHTQNDDLFLHSNKIAIGWCEMGCAQGTVNAKNKPVSSQKRVQKPSSVIQSLELYGNELNDSGDFLWRLVVLLGLKQQID